MVASLLLAMTGCQAHAPREGTLRTEDVSPVIYNYPWLKEHMLMRDLQVQRLDGDMLQVVARFHSTEAHESREVFIRTEFYSPKMDEGGVMVDHTDWQKFVLRPRKSVQYVASSMVPADDYRIYVNYGEDIGKH